MNWELIPEAMEEIGEGKRFPGADLRFGGENGCARGLTGVGEEEEERERRGGGEEAEPNGSAPPTRAT